MTTPTLLVLLALAAPPGRSLDKPLKERVAAICAPGEAGDNHWDWPRVVTAYANLWLAIEHRSHPDTIRQLMDELVAASAMDARLVTQTKCNAGGHNR